jgi:hypothetical protein
MNDINTDGAISTSTKTIYDSTLLLNGEKIKYNKLTLKSEISELISHVEQVITVVIICDYNQGPRQEIIPEHVKLSLNAPDNIIIQDLHHTNVSTTPDGFSLFTLKGKYYGTNVSWDIHHILED